MIVRIRFGTRIGQAYQPPSNAERAIGPEEELHTPLPVHPASRWLTRLTVALTLFALWRLGVDLELVPGYLAEMGILRHWQLWLALAIGSQSAVFTLDRRVRREELASFASLLQTVAGDDKSPRDT